MCQIKKLLKHHKQYPTKQNISGFDFSFYIICLEDILIKEKNAETPLWMREGDGDFLNLTILYLVKKEDYGSEIH